MDGIKNIDNIGFLSFVGGHSLMVEPQPSKLMMRVRFPLPAPVFGGISFQMRSCSSVGRAHPW